MPTIKIDNKDYELDTLMRWSPPQTPHQSLLAN